MQYKGAHKPLPQIARELGVDAVVEGSVLRDGSRVRITAQLLHAPSDRQLWTRSYERDLTDVITLQREVAASVATEVRAKLTVQEKARLATPKAVNAKAYESYLRGRHLLNAAAEDSVEKSIVYFEQARQEDPGFGLPRAGLAEAQLFLAGNFKKPPREAYLAAKRLAEEARDCDPTLGETLTVLAYTRMITERRWDEAEHEFKRALELSPNSATAHELYAWYLTARGRLEEALAEMKRASDLDPLSPLLSTGVGGVLMYRGQLDEAIEQNKKTLDWSPGFFVAHYGLGRFYLKQGKYDAAIASLRQADAISAGSPSVVADLAHAYALAGKRAEALKEFDRWRELTRQGYARPEQAAHIHAALGEREKAFTLLERAQEEGSPGIVWLKVDPRFDLLRGDPRFGKILARLGLQS